MFYRTQAEDRHNFEENIFGRANLLLILMWIGYKLASGADPNCVLFSSFQKTIKKVTEYFYKKGTNIYRRGVGGCAEIFTNFWEAVWQRWRLHVLLFLGADRIFLQERNKYIST